MMCAQTLSRGSDAYRKGYYAGYDGLDRDISKCGPFSEYDYDEGYKAGECDRKYDKARYHNNARG